MKFSAKAFLIVILMAGAFVPPLLAQDESGVAAPPPPPGGDMGEAPAPGTGPDAGSGAPGAGVTFQTFYDALGNQGSWIQTTDYGYVWQPTVTDPGWAPYTLGHWVYSDDGWTWVSDETFGWATYHYGRWANLDGIGWVWVSGYTWAPAWVSWRYGQDNVGWAPLPPDSMMGVDYASGDPSSGDAFHIGGDCDAYYGIGPACYQFLPILYLGYPDYHDHYFRRHRNFELINHTANVTNIYVRFHGGQVNIAAVFGGGVAHVTTGGPSLFRINAVSERPIQKVNLVQSDRPGGGTVNNHSLSLYAPRFRAAPSADIRPATVSRSVEHSTLNRGIDAAKPLIVSPRLAPAALTPEEIQQARQAQSQAPARANIATPDLKIKPVIQHPFTSLTPAVPVNTVHPQFTAPPNPNVPPTVAPHRPPATSDNTPAPHPSFTQPPTSHYTQPAEPTVPPNHPAYTQPVTPHYPQPGTPGEPTAPPSHPSFSQPPPPVPHSTPPPAPPRYTAPPAYAPAPSSSGANTNAPGTGGGWSGGDGHRNH